LTYPSSPFFTLVIFIIGPDVFCTQLAPDLDPTTYAAHVAGSHHHTQIFA
jgi:hypothetical protein